MKKQVINLQEIGTASLVTLGNPQGCMLEFEKPSDNGFRLPKGNPFRKPAGQ